MNKALDAEARPRGRPSFEPTDEQRYSVELMASIGIPHDQMALALGIASQTLRKHFPDELAGGKTKTIARVAESLVRQALAGNITAAIFYLKAQAGWRDRPPEDIGKKEQVEINARTAERGSRWDELLN